MIPGIVAAQRQSQAPVASLYTVLSETDKSGNVLLSGGGLVAKGLVNGSGLARSIATISGKTYFEGVFTDQVGTGAVIAVGVATTAHTVGASLGYANPEGWAAWGSSVGLRSNGATVLAFSAVDGDVFGVAVDKPAGMIWFRKNGVFLQGDPVAGTGASWSNLGGKVLHAAACPWGLGNIVTMRFDPAQFRDAAPAGFSPMLA